MFCRCRQHTTSNKSGEISLLPAQKTPAMFSGLYTPSDIARRFFRVFALPFFRCAHDRPKRLYANKKIKPSPAKAGVQIARMRDIIKKQTRPKPLAFRFQPTADSVAPQKAKLRAFARSGFPLSRERNHFFAPPIDGVKIDSDQKRASRLCALRRQTIDLAIAVAHAKNRANCATRPRRDNAYRGAGERKI